MTTDLDLLTTSEVMALADANSRTAISHVAVT